MAEVISLDRMIHLLAEAQTRGAQFAWIEHDRLKVGATLASPKFRVALGSEELLAEDANSGTTAPHVAHGAEPDRGRATQGAHGDSSCEAPIQLASQWELPDFPGRRTGSYHLSLEDKVYTARSQKELLLIGFCAIERVRPGTLAKLECDKTRTKRVVARRREALNDNPALAARFSHEIEGGWWVLTNNSFAETEKFLRRAGFHAGLKIDVRKLA